MKHGSRYGRNEEIRCTCPHCELWYMRPLEDFRNEEPPKWYIDNPHTARCAYTCDDCKDELLAILVG